MVRLPILLVLSLVVSLFLSNITIFGADTTGVKNNPPTYKIIHENGRLINIPQAYYLIDLNEATDDISEIVPIPLRPEVNEWSWVWAPGSVVTKNGYGYYYVVRQGTLLEVAVPDEKWKNLKWMDDVIAAIKNYELKHPEINKKRSEYRRKLERAQRQIKIEDNLRPQLRREQRDIENRKALRYEIVNEPIRHLWKQLVPGTNWYFVNSGQSEEGSWVFVCDNYNCLKIYVTEQESQNTAALQERMRAVITAYEQQRREQRQRAEEEKQKSKSWLDRLLGK